MTSEQSSLLSHPLTIAAFGVACTIAGWVITQVWALTKDNSTWKKSIESIDQLLLRMADKQDDIDHRLSNLEGEHNMMMRAVKMIEQHNIKGQ